MPTDAASRQSVVSEGLFSWPADEPRLIGSRCRDCGTVTFPSQGGCPKCCGEEVEEISLSRRGRLWSWTVQGFLPKSPPYAGTETPETFVPFGVGYIELPEGLKVEARLTENDPARLKIGMEMELTILPFAADVDGGERLTYFFQPVEA